LLLLLTCTGCLAQTKCPAHDATCDPRSQLAMDYMYDRFGDADNTSVMVIERPETYTVSYRLRLESREHTFEKLEAWARTLAPADREAYLGVIDYYEDGAKAAYREWHTHDELKQQLAFEKHQRECEEAARKLSSSHPLPKPPQ
jgi:hypothetical protein